MFIFAFCSILEIFSDIARTYEIYDKGDKDEMPAKVMVLSVVLSMIACLFWMRYMTSKDGVAARKLALTGQ